jgi:hypothetical protein
VTQLHNVPLWTQVVHSNQFGKCSALSVPWAANLDRRERLFRIQQMSARSAEERLTAYVIFRFRLPAVRFTAQA